MLPGIDDSGNTLQRYKGLTTSPYVTCLVIESHLESAFSQLGYVPTQKDYDALVPLIFQLRELSRSDEVFYEYAVGEITRVLDRLGIVGGDAMAWASRLFWAITIESRTESPAFFWGRQSLASSLKAARRVELYELPVCMTAWRFELMAAFTSPTPDGSAVVLLHRGLIAIRDYQWGQLVAYLRKQNCRQKTSDPKKLISGGLAADIALFEYFFRDYCLNPLRADEVDAVLPAMVWNDHIPHSMISCVDRGIDVFFAFLVLHELAHIVNGDLRASSTTREDRHNAEFAADSFAIQILQCDPQFQISDLTTICAVFEFFARKKAMAGQPLSSMTHPSDLERTRNLIEQVAMPSSTKNELIRMVQFKQEMCHKYLAEVPFLIRRSGTLLSVNSFPPPPIAFDPREREFLEILKSHPDTIPLDHSSVMARSDSATVWKVAASYQNLLAAFDMTFRQWLQLDK